MKRDKRKNAQSTNTAGSQTEVRYGHDLHATLKALTDASAHGGINRLENVLAALAKEFHPSSVTMTSTNIPDAINKLSAVVDETGEATQRVLDLAERQKSLLREHDLHAAALARLLRQNPVNSNAALAELEKSSASLTGLRALAHQIVEAQEYQDLCSQKVEKVIRLLSSLDDRLRLLFDNLKYPISSESTAGHHVEESDIDQKEADDILKRFGI